MSLFVFIPPICFKVPSERVHRQGASSQDVRKRQEDIRTRHVVRGEGRRVQRPGVTVS